MRFVFLLSMLVFFSCSALAAPSSIPAVDASRSVAIDSPIRRNNLDKIQAQLFKLASDDSDKPVSILLDSPGGSVTTGFSFVNALEELKARGVVIRCYVGKMAASMAFQILVHCNERYALSRSFLLWHGVRTQTDGPITSASAAALHADLSAIDKVIRKELLETLGLPEDVVEFHFRQETLHIGENLAVMTPGFINTAPSIPGLYSAFSDKNVVKTSDEKDMFSFLFGEITYEYLGRGK